MRADESSRHSLDCSHGVHRIPPDGPGPANFQQPLNYGRIPRSSSRISPCRHVHSPGEAPTKTCFDCSLYRANHAGLGAFPRKPRSRSEVKSLIQKGKLEVREFRCSVRLSHGAFPSRRLQRRHAQNVSVGPNGSECNRDFSPTMLTLPKTTDAICGCSRARSLHQWLKPLNRAAKEAQQKQQGPLGWKASNRASNDFQGKGACALSRASRACQTSTTNKRTSVLPVALR